MIGLLHDRTGGYQTPMFVVAGALALAAVLAIRLVRLAPIAPR